MCVGRVWTWYDVYAYVTACMYKHREKPDVYKHSFIQKYIMNPRYEADTTLISGDKILRKDKHKLV